MPTPLLSLIFTFSHPFFLHHASHTKSEEIRCNVHMPDHFCAFRIWEILVRTQFTYDRSQLSYIETEKHGIDYYSFFFELRSCVHAIDDFPCNCDSVIASPLLVPL